MGYFLNHVVVMLDTNWRALYCLYFESVQSTRITLYLYTTFYVFMINAPTLVY